MSDEKVEENSLLPQHDQQPLCTTRLPYRQGRKLTAVKVYTVNNESNHLLVFGVPSLNLRRETKDLFIKFGKLLQFHVTSDYPVEEFTETYHAYFEKIQSARIAKKMLDTKNFYGGSLHICYAPELETIEETRAKLLQRKKDVVFRLRNLQKVSPKPVNVINSNLNVNNEDIWNFNVNNKVEINLPVNSKDDIIENQIINEVPNYNVEINNINKINMGENNLIYVNKRKFNKKNGKQKKLKTNFNTEVVKSNEDSLIENNLDVIDCKSVDKVVVSDINEALNYNTFGNEVIKKVELKPANKIIFNINKKM